VVTGFYQISQSGFVCSTESSTVPRLTSASRRCRSATDVKHTKRSLHRVVYQLMTTIAISLL